VVTLLLERVTVLMGAPVLQAQGACRYTMPLLAVHSLSWEQPRGVVRKRCLCEQERSDDASQQTRSVVPDVGRVSPSWRPWTNVLF
jgi:hypothetical protein